jgi:hypothetical protein
LLVFLSSTSAGGWVQARRGGRVDDLQENATTLVCACSSSLQTLDISWGLAPTRIESRCRSRTVAGGCPGSHATPRQPNLSLIHLAEHGKGLRVSGRSSESIVHRSRSSIRVGRPSESTFTQVHRTWLGAVEAVMPRSARPIRVVSTSGSLHTAGGGVLHPIVHPTRSSSSGLSRSSIRVSRGPLGSPPGPRAAGARRAAVTLGPSESLPVFARAHPKHTADSET